ncbi:helix-turn-helix domain-containing protein [Lachnospiraceae bacterium OttesenSCG-928-D06]|nr:helix-turn-helix domain-containing protein [Lachnospiraceae bacterium OttesenSCG-928-D06]
MKSNIILDFDHVEENLLPNERLIIKTYVQEELPYHSHQFFELAYVTEGSAIHSLNGDCTVLKPGDYFIIDYDSIHSYANCQDLTLINCLFLSEILGDTLSECRSFNTLMHGCLFRYHKLYIGKNPADKIFHDKNGRILALLQGMIQEYNEKQPGFDEIFKCRLLEVLILIMRNIIDHTKITANNSSLLELISYINHNYQKPRLLSDFCETYHFAPPYISRKFKQETGFSVREYLHKIRMEKCCELLTGSDLPVVEIATLIGYHDIKFFNALFKRMLKMTPREYRRMTTA